MTAPLVPEHVDLSGYEFMPLYGDYLFGSDFNARVSDTAWRVAVTLWWKAWKQVPAASLPNDDAALAKLAELGRDVRSFRKVKDEALHGFVLCDDGRLYHPRLAVWALEAWERRVRERERKAHWRAKRHGAEHVGPADEGRGQDGDRTGTQGGTGRGRPRSEGWDVPSEGKRSEAKGSEAKGSEGNPRSSKAFSNRDVLHTRGRPKTAADATAGNGHPPASVPPWWKTAEGVNATARTMGMDRHTGETDAAFKDRVFAAVEEKRLRATSQVKRSSH